MKFRLRSIQIGGRFGKVEASVNPKMQQAMSVATLVPAEDGETNLASWLFAR